MKKILGLFIFILMLSACTHPIVLPAVPDCGYACEATTITGNVSFDFGEIIENHYKILGLYVTFSGSPVYIFKLISHETLFVLRESAKQYELTLVTVGNVSIPTYGIGVHSVPLWYIKSYEEVGQ